MSEKNAFIANQKNFISRNFTNFTQSRFLRTKNFFCTCLSSLSEKISIYTNQKLLKAYEPPSKAALLHTKALHFCTSLFSLSAKISHFYKPKAFLSHKPFLLPPKATLFCPPPPISTPLNLLFAKNTAVLLLFALILCCKAGASHRFKSLPAIPGEVAAFRKTGYLMNAGHFRKNHVSTGDLNRPRSPEVRKPLVYFWFFSYTRKE